MSNYGVKESQYAHYFSKSRKQSSFVANTTVILRQYLTLSISA